jgi:hypothetical protein
MQLFTHFKTDETSYITARLNKAEFAHLREWMHTEAGERVGFPHGVKLFYRAEGWYRMDTTNSHRAIEKLKSAMAIVKSWHHQYRKAVAQEIRLLMVQAHPELQITSYRSDNHTYQVRNNTTGQTKPVDQVVKEVQPLRQELAKPVHFDKQAPTQVQVQHKSSRAPSVGALQALANKFGARHN